MAPARPTTDDLAGRTPEPYPADQLQGDQLQGDQVQGDQVQGDQLRGGQPAAAPPQDAPLLDDREADDFLARWSEVQGRFVDDPQGAVRDGDSLVAELMQALAARFSDHKGRLEEQWQRGSEPETEELRLALQQYRSFFQRLLST